MHLAREMYDETTKLSTPKTGLEGEVCNHTFIL